MRVILLQKVNKVGERYQVVEVASGYARNFLFPRGLAKPASEKNVKALQAKKKAWQKKKEKRKKKFEKEAEKMKGTEIRIGKKVNEEGRLFGSVDKAAIREKLEQHGFVMEEAEIGIEEPVKETGERTVEISFPFGAESEITLIVEEE